MYKIAVKEIFERPSMRLTKQLWRVFLAVEGWFTFVRLSPFLKKKKHKVGFDNIAVKSSDHFESSDFYKNQ